MEDSLLAQGAYKQQPIEGFDIDQELSNIDKTVYVNKETGHATVAFSGTRIKGPLNETTWRDLTTDFLMFVGQGSKSSRFKKSRQATQRAIEKYGLDNVSVTGHSLGGSIALEMSNELGVRATAFNPYINDTEEINRYINKRLTDSGESKTFKLRPTKDYSKAQVFSVPGDPVAANTFYNKGIKVESVYPLKSYGHIAKNAYTGKYTKASVLIAEGAGKAYEGDLSGLKDVYEGTKQIYQDIAPLHDISTFTSRVTPRTYQEPLPSKRGSKVKPNNPTADIMKPRNSTEEWDYNSASFPSSSTKKKKNQPSERFRNSGLTIKTQSRMPSPSTLVGQEFAFM